MYLTPRRNTPLPTHSYGELRGAERFGDVVVRAELQAVNAVIDGAAACQDENRGPPGGLGLAVHFGAVNVRQAKIEQHQVGRCGRE